MVTHPADGRPLILAIFAVQAIDPKANHAPSPPSLQPGMLRAHPTGLACGGCEGQVLWAQRAPLPPGHLSLRLLDLGPGEKAQLWHWRPWAPRADPPPPPGHAYLLVPRAVLHAAAPLRLHGAFAATRVRRHHEAVPCGPAEEAREPGAKEGRRCAVSPAGAEP